MSDVNWRLWSLLELPSNDGGELLRSIMNISQPCCFWFLEHFWLVQLKAHDYFPALKCHRQRVDPARWNLNIVSWHLLINSNGISVPRKWHTALFTDRVALSLKCHPVSSPRSCHFHLISPAPLCLRRCRGVAFTLVSRQSFTVQQRSVICTGF